MLLGISWSHPNDNVEIYNLGLEYGYQDMAFLRFGKKINGISRWNWKDYQGDIEAGKDAKDHDPLHRIPAVQRRLATSSATARPSAPASNCRGLGLTIDYAYTGISYLDNIHRFSLGYQFPKLIF